MSEPDHVSKKDNYVVEFTSHFGHPGKVIKRSNYAVEDEARDAALSLQAAGYENVSITLYSGGKPQRVPLEKPFKEEEKMTERDVEYVVEFIGNISGQQYRNVYESLENARQDAQWYKLHSNRNVTLYRYEQGKHTKLPIDETTEDTVESYVVTYTDTEGKSHSRVLKELSWAQGFYEGLTEAGAQPKIYKMVPLEES